MIKVIKSDLEMIRKEFSLERRTTVENREEAVYVGGSDSRARGSLYYGPLWLCQDTWTYLSMKEIRRQWTVRINIYSAV